MDTFCSPNDLSILSMQVFMILLFYNVVCVTSYCVRGLLGQISSWTEGVKSVNSRNDGLISTGGNDSQYIQKQMQPCEH